MENYQIEQRIKIDFAYSGVPPRVYAKQYDNNMRVVAVGQRCRPLCCAGRVLREYSHGEIGRSPRL